MGSPLIKRLDALYQRAQMVMKVQADHAPFVLSLIHIFPFEISERFFIKVSFKFITYLFSFLYCKSIIKMFLLSK